jgi:hypothetical protein
MITNISDTVANHSRDVYVETYGIEVKVVFVFISLIALSSSVLAMAVMHRTKRIPYASKWLSSGLLIFDVLLIISSTIRKCVTNPIVSVHLQTTITIFAGLSYFTVGLMSLERYIVVVKPLEYLTRFSQRKIRQLSIVLWISEFGLCLLFRYGVIRYF